MGITAAIASTVVGAVVNKRMRPKVQSPGSPAPAPTTDPKEAKDASEAASAQARKRAQAAGGRSDTILTGSQGLGEIGAENTQKSTLLGY